MEPSDTQSNEVIDAEENSLRAKHVIVLENQHGVSYDDLFGPYLKGAQHITITDPYIRMYYQARNLMEFLETVNKVKTNSDEVIVNLVTVEDPEKGEMQRDWLDQTQGSLLAVGVKFGYSFDNSGSQHARHIVTDTN